MPKAKLIEQIASLISDKKLPILADVRDESDEEIRIVLEPQEPHRRSADADGQPVPADRSRSAHPAQPQRAGRAPHAARDEPVAGADRVAGASRSIVLVRRAEHRIAKIVDRVELLEGYLIAYLNLDRVIQIIRDGR